MTLERKLQNSFELWKWLFLATLAYTVKITTGIIDNQPPTTTAQWGVFIIAATTMILSGFRLHILNIKIGDA